MKLASLKHQRDGKLIVVSRDLTRAVDATDIAPTLQAALDNWSSLSPVLEKRYLSLNDNQCEGSFAFDPSACASPLPRAYQWADGSAYVNHVELVRKARGAEVPATFWTDPLMYQGMSDGFLGPQEDIPLCDEAWGCDFEAEIAVITDDVPMASTAADSADHIKLLMLVNDVSLRNLIPGELAKGFGFFQSKPASAFSPVAVTPDELGDAWEDNKVHLPLEVHLNHTQFGAPNAGVDMTFDFSQLVAHVAKSRHVSAGTIVGSGTVSNVDRSKGSCCLAERRMLEIIEHGEAKTPFMKHGDQVDIEMHDADGHSIFGKISQTVVPYSGNKA
ncbi:fumarylacetoacetate hydrolase family protein [Veronia pacifica]|uniref:2-keto-4-pentenoate hydratase n=1 Tax=Veronia pacifica TaxID=1080227 RepID=A0A1C3EC16_9GAMM|nr:fumarylacetoacetate hydrolase family protein [Veronia pacifica]ODA30775.1 2-keto-4-pentenoate hydratase [Veronia pacifica]